MEKIEVIQINNKEWTEIQGFSSKGKRVKSWYENINNEVYLYKEPKVYQSTGFVTKEIWTEFIAYKLGILYGLDIPKAIPAKKENSYGILIKSFLNYSNNTVPEIALAEAQDILTFTSIKLYHNIDTIKSLLTNNFVEKNAWQKFKKMLIFDCIIGNNDRHDENWGILYGTALKQIKFAPVYDNASCLTYGDNEENVIKLLSDDKKFEQYINNSKPPNLYINENNSKHFKHFEIMKYLVEKEEDFIDLVKNMVEIDCLKYTENILDEIIQTEIPEIYKISQNRKNLILKILDRRINKLREIINVYI